MKPTLIILSLITLSCTSNMPEQQAAFCEIIDDHRSKYTAIEDQGNSINKKEQLNQIFKDRKAALKNLLKEGNFKQWTGTLTELALSIDNDAITEITINCRSTLETTVKTQTENYEALKNYKEGDEIILSGNFTIGSSFNDSYYQENSFTQSGSIDEPEFEIEISEIHQQ